MWYRTIFKICRGALYFTFFFTLAYTFHSCSRSERFTKQYQNERPFYLIRKEKGCHIYYSVIHPIKSCGKKEGTTTPAGFKIPVLEEGKYYVRSGDKYIEISREQYNEAYYGPGIGFLLFGLIFFFGFLTNIFGKISEENFSVKAHFKHFINFYFRGKDA